MSKQPFRWVVFVVGSAAIWYAQHTVDGDLVKLGAAFLQLVYGVITIYGPDSARDLKSLFVPMTRAVRGGERKEQKDANNDQSPSV
jgi:hypothetical protein